MPIELPKWSMGLHKTESELAEYQTLADQGELPRDIVKQVLDAEDAAVHGYDAKKDRKGKRVQQGIGALGHETTNHYAAILRYEGRPAYEAAVYDLQVRDPKRHALLGLPKIPKKEKAA